MVNICQIANGSSVYNIQDTEAREILDTKQVALVSGVTIKTLNGNSLLGSGNIVVETGVQSDWDVTNTSSQAYIANKPTIPVVDQVYNASSLNAQSGVAIANVVADIETILHNINSGNVE